MGEESRFRVFSRDFVRERGDNLDSIAMHSNVAYYLQQVGMLTFSTSSLSTGGNLAWGGGGVGRQQDGILHGRRRNHRRRGAN